MNPLTYPINVEVTCEITNLEFLASKEIQSFLASFSKVCVNAVMPPTNKTQYQTPLSKPPDKELLWNLQERSFCEMGTRVKQNPKFIKQAGESEQLNFNFIMLSPAFSWLF